MRSLPLFHRVSGKPVIVLGTGEAAEAKRRLVERAGGRVIADIEAGLIAGARLAFVAHETADECERDAARLREAGLLVNVVDRPDLCDFTTPSVLDRDPVLLAIGTDGASAGLAKQLRLRLEAILPADLGALAEALSGARDALRRRYPGAAARRQALDAALGQGGALDPMAEGSGGRVAEWLDGGEPIGESATLTLLIASDDPDDLTLRQARLLGSADVIVAEDGIAPAILARARADAVRLVEPPETPGGLTLVLKRA